MILAIWASVALAYGSSEENGTEVVLGFGDARHGKLPPSLFLPLKFPSCARVCVGESNRSSDGRGQSIASVTSFAPVDLI
jgi:hypothetical protein